MKRIFFAFLILLSFGTQAQKISLNATTETLELSTSSTAGIDYQISYTDITASNTLGAKSVGKIVTATTTVILGAPAASTERIVTFISLYNIGTVSNTIGLRLDISATEYRLFSVPLAANELFIYDGEKYTLYDANGKQKAVDIQTISNGLTIFNQRTMTAADAAGYWYCASKDLGNTGGAWAPGTPGLAGRATDGTAVADAGCSYFPDAGGGAARFLTGINVTATALQSFYMMDILWINSGLVVTTTTAQTINSVALPARDDNGTTNGKGCWIGLLATGALGNAATVANSTVTYTNSAGTGSRTATLVAVVGSQFPATPVIGTVVWFTLQAGDEGVQSIQSITLNTTLTSGTASLIIARPIVSAPVSLANQFFKNEINNGLGVRLYDKACLFPFFQASSTTAPVVTLELQSSVK